MKTLKAGLVNEFDQEAAEVFLIFDAQNIT
jgi:hypothetical protein